MAAHSRLSRPFELKAVRDNGTFEGHGSVFGELDSHFDIVMPGAFKDSLADYESKGRKVPMLWQHDAHQPIGVYTTIGEDAKGLHVEGQIILDVQKGREAHALMKAEALSGLSIGYRAVKYDYNDAGVRLLHSVKLFEVSPVTFPSGDSARIASVKSIEGLTKLSECEELLRDAGFSRSEAKAFIARVKATSTSPSDSGVDEAALRRLKAAFDAIGV